jgi:hypothetical protein
MQIVQYTEGPCGHFYERPLSYLIRAFHSLVKDGTLGGIDLSAALRGWDDAVDCDGRSKLADS